MGSHRVLCSLVVLAAGVAALQGCATLDLVGLGPATPPPPEPLPFRLVLDPLAAPAPAPAAPEVHPVSLDWEGMGGPLAEALDGKVFQGVVSREEAQLRLRLVPTACELRYVPPAVNRILWFLWNCNVSTSFFPDETYRARLDWRLEVLVARTGERVYAKDLSTVSERRITDWQRRFIPFSSLRLPGCLVASDWERIGEPLLPALAAGLVGRSHDDLVLAFAAVTRTPEFQRALEGRAAPAAPLPSAPEITLETEGNELRVRTDSLDLAYVVTGPPETTTYVEVNGKVGGSKPSDAGGTRDVAAVGPTRLGTQGSRVKVRYHERLPLVEGANRVRVVAAAPDGALSEELLTVWYETHEGRTYVLAVGVADYQDPAIPDLRWTENDAAAVARFFREDPTSPARPEDVKLLVGKEATKLNILKGINTHLERQAVHEEDRVVFFFAGHGGMGTHPSLGTEYYLYPHDAEQDVLSVTGLETSELQRRWSAIRAQTRVFISDACHGGGIAVRADAAGAERVGTGSVTFSAAKASEQSMEASDLEHGLFTYHLVQGLAGAADKETGDRDGRVQVMELKAYLDRRVPSAAARAGGRQNPVTRVESSGTIYLTK